MHSPSVNNHFPVFADQPSDSFVEDWRTHIANTGYPETHPHVSTSKPGPSDNLLFLSADIKVPVGRRLEGRRVPCPYCSGMHPKFETGRMAYFPDEHVVRFIGRQCAQTHHPEGYSQADKRFRMQEACRRYVREWPLLQSRRPVILEFVDLLRPIAADAQFLRWQLERDAPDFIGYFERAVAQTGGELFVTQNLGMKDRHGNAVVQKRSIGRASGMSFFAHDFEPKAALSKIATVLNDIAKPLPDWTPVQESNEATREIIRRGKAAEAVMEKLATVWRMLADTQSFFDRKNLRAIERWASAPDNGAFDTFELKRVDGQVLLRATSIRGPHYSNLIVPETMFATLPIEGVELLQSANGDGNIGRREENRAA